LALLVGLVLESESTKQPIFPSLIDEPVFFRRYIKPWILEGVQEYRSLDVMKNKALEGRTGS